MLLHARCHMPIEEHSVCCWCLKHDWKWREWATRFARWEKSMYHDYKMIEHVEHPGYPPPVRSSRTASGT